MVRTLEDLNVVGDIVAASLSSGLHFSTWARDSEYFTEGFISLGALPAAWCRIDAVILSVDALCGGGTRPASHLCESRSNTTIDPLLITVDSLNPRESVTWLHHPDYRTHLANTHPAPKEDT